MLKGGNINLRLIERDEIGILHEWENDPSFIGEYEPVMQSTMDQLEKQYDERGENGWFFIESKDERKIGVSMHMGKSGYQIIGYYLAPTERGKGYGTEAVRMMVDYLFLGKNIVRIQAETHPDNIASQRVLLKNGFKREGVIRKSFFSRGVFRDTVLFSVLRDEWDGPSYSW